MRPKVTLAVLPIPADQMPGWRTMWPGEWRYRAFMLSIGWRIAHVAAWFISVGINRPTGCSGASRGAPFTGEFEDIEGATSTPTIGITYTHRPL